MTFDWNLRSIASQAGKRFLITGANSGIGYAASLELARKGGAVVLACRDRARGDEAVGRIKAAVPGAAVELILLDLSSLDSVRAVAREFVARGVALDVLVNNAGVMAPPARCETKDGFELQWGTNVLGHFALTCLLLPALRQAKSARVVTISSIAHKRGQIHFDDLQSVKSYSPMGAYGQSKLGDLMFAFELQRRLQAAGLEIKSIAAHPGVAKTPLFKFGNSQGIYKLMETAQQTMIGLLMGSDTDGALPTLFAATSDLAEGGGYYGPQGIQETRGGNVGPAKVMPQAADVAAQERLWEVCVASTGCEVL